MPDHVQNRPVPEHEVAARQHPRGRQISAAAVTAASGLPGVRASSTSPSYVDSVSSADPRTTDSARLCGAPPVSGRNFTSTSPGMAGRS